MLLGKATKTLLVCGAAAVLAGCEMPLGSTEDWPMTLVPTPVKGDLRFSDVDGEHPRSCGIAEGDVYCWGMALITEGTGGPAPRRVHSGLRFVSVELGQGFSCALSDGGRAFCWGYGGMGQLGTGNRANSSQPAAVLGNHVFSKLDVGSGLACGVDASGAAYCWGHGYAGNNAVGEFSQPVRVAGNLDFSDVQSGALHSCGLTAGGAVYCWGNNFSGKLGNGLAGSEVSNADRLLPDRVQSDVQYRAIAIGQEHSCALSTTGAPYCWGFRYGTRPAPVSGGRTFASMYSGGFHSCGLTDSGEAFCWGKNDFGQLGDGSRTERSAPVLVRSGIRFRSLSLGGLHSCGITTEGRAYCWGKNGDGQLGTG